MYDDISRNLNDLREKDTSISNGEFERYEKTISNILNQSDDLLKQAEAETRSHSSAERKVLNEKVVQFKDQFANLRSQFSQESNRLQKSLLMGSANGNAKIRMMETNEK